MTTCGDKSEDSDSNDPPKQNDNTADSETDSATPDRGDSAIATPADCDIECEPGQFCSSSGECISKGSCRNTTDCPLGRKCVDGICEIDDECGAEEFTLQEVAPNLLILLDRSCSMPRCSTYDLQLLKNCANLSNVDKWGIAVDAITALTETYLGRVRWGLKFFPDATGDDCLQDPPEIVPSDNNEEEIQRILADALDVEDPNFPIGPCVTNINAAVRQMSEEACIRDSERGNYILLITDGVEANCAGNNNDTRSIVADLAADGIITFVVGFGGGVNPLFLNRLATAGGSPNSALVINYYQADDLETLQEALSNIVGRILGCDFQLDETPENIDEIYVWADDDVSIKRDDPNGWRYQSESNRVVFQGIACENIKNEAYQDIDVVFGCDAPIIE